MPPSTSQTNNDIAHPGTYGGKNYSDYTVFEKKAFQYIAAKKLRHITDTEKGKEPKKPDGDEPPYKIQTLFPVRGQRVVTGDAIDPTRAATQGNRHTDDSAKAHNEGVDRDYKDAVDKYNADSKIIEATHRHWTQQMAKYEKWRNETDEAIAIFENLFPRVIGESVRRSQDFKNGPQTFHDFIDGYKRYYNVGVRTGTEATYWKSSLQQISVNYSGSNRPRDIKTIESIIDQFDEAGFKGFEVIPRTVFNDQQVHKTILMEYCNTWGFVQPQHTEFFEFSKKNRDEGINGWDNYYDWIAEVRMIIASMKHFDSKTNLRNNPTNGGNNNNSRKPGDPYTDTKRKVAKADDKGKNKKRKQNHDDDNEPNDSNGSTGFCEYHNINGHPTNKCNHLKRLRESKNKADRREYAQIMREIRNKRDQDQPQAKRSKKSTHEAKVADKSSDKSTYDLRQELTRAIDTFETIGNEVVLAKKSVAKCVICKDTGHTDLVDCPTLSLLYAKKALKQATMGSGNGTGTGSKVNDIIAPRSHFAHDKLTDTHLRDEMIIVTNTPSQALRGKTTHPLWKSLLGEARLFHVSRDSKMFQNNSFNKSLADSGSSSCMSEDKSIFNTFEPVQNEYVYLADDHKIPIEGKGTVVLDFGRGLKRTLNDVLYVPDLSETLFSISHLLDKSDDLVIFDFNTIYLYVRSKDLLICIGNRIGSLYYINITKASNSFSTLAKIGLTKLETAA
ncbi:hypothetical protein HDU76_009274, partial [Blyttiomyces sp. JEL0837]